MRKTVRTFAVLSLVAMSAGAAWADQAQPARILVGPGVLVSSESEYPHVEMVIAAHPSDPRKLVAGSMILGGNSGTIIYSSTDGGATWMPHYPAGRLTSEADPLVLYTPRGTALFVDLPLTQRTPEGKQYLPLAFYRSEDGGQVWQRPILLGDTTQGHDHPWITADPRSGRIYISTLYGMPSTLGHFRSDDDGRTFTGPKEMIRSASDDIGYGPVGLAVLSNGALVHLFMESPIAQPDGTYGHKGWVMISRDGGETFGKPLAVATGSYPPKSLEQEHGGRVQTFWQMAVDPSAGPYRDRLYAAWTDYGTGLPQVMLTWSADRGETWSEPRPVGGPLPAGAYSYQHAMTVNKEGVLGVSWLDTRNHPGSDRYDAYFSASLDGGETWLPPARLSSETSDPLGTGNLRPSGTVWHDRQESIRLSFLSPLNQFPHGGHYVGLAADADGAFHPLWPDARTGTFQAWTTKVRVEHGPAAPPRAGPASAAPPIDLKAHVELLIDPSVYDAAARELRLPIRIRNRSDRPIRGPLQVQVKTFASGEGPKESTAAILNAANGQPGAGAVFDYGKALGDFDVLEPGAVTEPVVWRFKLPHVRTPNLHLEVTGRVD